MEIKIRIREHGQSPFEYLICSDSTHNNFKLVKHWLKHSRVGVLLLDTSTGIQMFGHDENLTCLGYDFVRIPEEVVRKVEDLKYTVVALLTMKQHDEVRLKMKELKQYLKFNYFVLSNPQN